MAARRVPRRSELALVMVGAAMKRAGLRVRTGVRAPARIVGMPDGSTQIVSAPVAGIGAWLKPWVDCPCGSKEHQEGGHDRGRDTINMTPLVPLIRCTFVVPCGVCHYCKVATQGPEYWAR